eukprot:CAMPEP_0115850990 /NCGR_PEP_ID=MMETSP0287-20121206/12248_1 /TAXON_ID=412157 /ORGANISM="Chrysochromulina rotalis, Strain UIO044" /LENGTH=104 /DNA_ID=CAMNT_0003305003 /DNA_START=131 /DNA_END=445 /DNA_ORIENTATION=+
MNYTLSEFGDHIVITPRCYFDAKPGKTTVKLNRERGCVAIEPKRKPKMGKQDYACNTSKMIYGGVIYLPKKCDLSQEIEIDHEGPVKQVLLLRVKKLPEFCTDD